MTGIPDRAFSLWKNFAHVRVNPSIDDLGERNTYIRHPTNWSTVQESIKRLQEHKIEFNILQTISAMNFYYLDEFFEWANSQGIAIAYNFVFDPKFLSPAALPTKIRKTILNKLIKRLPNHLFEPISALYNNSVENQQDWQQFVSYTKLLDKVREENFRNSFPELTELLLTEGYEVP